MTLTDPHCVQFVYAVSRAVMFQGHWSVPLQLSIEAHTGTPPAADWSSAAVSE